MGAVMTEGEFLKACERKVFESGSEKQQWAWLRWMNGLGSPGRVPRIQAVREAQNLIRLEELLLHLDLSVEEAKQAHGKFLAGFAFVAWSQNGELYTSYSAEHGPISNGLVPTLVADALNRHVAVMTADAMTVHRLNNGGQL